VTTGADWRTYLATVPSWAIEAEAIRRAEVNDRATITLPGLVVNPTGNSVTWRGDTYALGGRSMEVVYVLAQARQRGERWLRREKLGHRVWRGWTMGDAANNASVAVSGLRRRFPGLIDSPRKGAFGLVLDEPAAERGAA
jgi:DNA-binding response OmpR family regulator